MEQCVERMLVLAVKGAVIDEEKRIAIVSDIDRGWMGELGRGFRR